MSNKELADLKTLTDTGKVLVSKSNAASFLKACWNANISVNFEKTAKGILFTKK